MPHLGDPDLVWRDRGTPASGRFDDIYFSADDGLAETRHVFLDGIGAPMVWAGRRRFTIGELGFGTGLNFLATWKLWRETAPAEARLNYVAIEGFPLAAEALADAIAAFPELADEARQLLDALPPRLGDFHQRSFDAGRVTLLLIYGDAQSALDELVGRMDAWYLDGFAPAKNPDMWTAAVLAAVAAHSRPDARLTTFTAAGAVRRGLAEVGFVPEKRTGFGNKREHLTARFEGPQRRPDTDPWYAFPPVVETSGSITIVGAGIAGATLARALSDAGARITVIDRSAGPAGKASGNPAGVIHPRPLADGSPAAVFHAAAYGRAVGYYDALSGAWRHRGLLVFGRDAEDRERYAAFAAAGHLPDGWAQCVDAPETRRLCGHDHGPGVWFPEAGVIDTTTICAGLLDNVDCRYDEPLEVLPNDGPVVVAAGIGSPALSGFAHLGLVENRGQVSFLPATEKTANLQCALMFGGYLTPADKDQDQDRGQHVLGATFNRRHERTDDEWTALSEADHARNLAVLEAGLPAYVGEFPTADGGWTGVRATTSDRLPVLGGIPDTDHYTTAYADLRHGRHVSGYPDARYRPDAYVAAGFGSHGYLMAPLAADILTAMILGTPLPVAKSVALALHPARFLIRNLRRGRPNAIC